MALAREIMGGGISAMSAIAIGGGAGSTAAAGSLQTDATEIPTSTNIVTAADGTKGVRLPACQPGESVVIFNNSASTLKVWPPTGAAISVTGTGLGTANAAFSHLTYKPVRYFCQSSTQWFALVGA